MKKILVVVDMQNDFIDGSLGTKEAENIVSNVIEKIKQYENDESVIYYTKDTHFDNYMTTQEGLKLPVPHCIKNTDGWRINKLIDNAANNNPIAKVEYIDKPSFGAGTLIYDAIVKAGEPCEITICGTCTDICVVSNALILKSFFPEVPMNVIADCCAGLTKEKHAAALEVMSSCQINII